MANWNVYVPQRYEARLQALALEGESIGQVIKKLVLGLLDAENPQITAPSTDSLEEIRDRLDDHETRLKALENPDHPIGRFLKKAKNED